MGLSSPPVRPTSIRARAWTGRRQRSDRAQSDQRRWLRPEHSRHRAGRSIFGAMRATTCSWSTSLGNVDLAHKYLAGRRPARRTASTLDCRSPAKSRACATQSTSTAASATNPYDINSTGASDYIVNVSNPDHARDPADGLGHADDQRRPRQRHVPVADQLRRAAAISERPAAIDIRADQLQLVDQPARRQRP